jgi:hypothetical protein
MTSPPPAAATSSALSYVRPQEFDDLSTIDRVEEAGPTSTNPDPRPSPVVVFTELDTQVAYQASLAMCDQRFVAA